MYVEQTRGGEPREDPETSLRLQGVALIEAGALMRTSSAPEGRTLAHVTHLQASGAVCRFTLSPCTRLHHSTRRGPDVQVERLFDP